MWQAGAPLRTIERRNQTPQLGRIETRLYFDPKPLTKHDPKPSAPSHARCPHRVSGPCTILNNLDRNNLLPVLRLRNALAPRIQRKHVQPVCLAELFTPKTALFELRNQTLCFCKRPEFPSGMTSGLRTTMSSWLMSWKREVCIVLADTERYWRSDG